MFCDRLISPQIEPLSPEDTVGEALLRLDELSIGHLPVADNGRFLGLLSEVSLLDADELSSVSTLQPHLLPCQVRSSELFTMAARFMVSMHTDLVAVVDGHGGYEGAITRETLFHEIASVCGMSGGGSILVLEMERSFYSPAEICRLVESNDALATQLHTHVDPSTSLLTVWVRVNREEVSDVAATFRRHGYTVLHQQGQDSERDDLISNLENLMNYLNV